MHTFQLIIITWPTFLPNEALQLNRLLDAGVSRLHIRKPDASKQALEDLLLLIPSRYYPRIVLHDYFELAMQYGLGGVHLNRRNPLPPKNFGGEVSCSCHSLDELQAAKQHCAYVSLSPIFDSTSKQGYSFAFSPSALTEAQHNGLIDERVMALSGINESNVTQARAWGFGGVMVLGYIWQTSNHQHDGTECLQRYYKLQEILENRCCL